MTFYKKRGVRRMPAPLREGTQIYVERKTLGVSYSMPVMAMAMDYYEIGYIISGDRKTITPTATYFANAGMVGLTPPYVYHRTMAVSDEPYERILIKFTRAFAEPFIREVGQQVFDLLYEQKICQFTKESQEKICHMFMEMAEEYNIHCLENETQNDYIILLDEMVDMGILSKPNEGNLYRLRRSSFVDIIGENFDVLDAEIISSNEEV